MSRYEINSCTLSGRLGADAELRYSADGNPVVNFRMGISRDRPNRQNPDGEWEKRTIWMRCVLFGRTELSDLVAKLVKGAHVCVVGELDMVEHWQGQEGKCGASTDFKIAGPGSVTFMDRPPREDNGQGDYAPQQSRPQQQQRPAQQTTAARAQQQAPQKDDTQDLEDLPF